MIARPAGDVLATLDFGPVVSRDVRRAGRIAAIHALSDVYACGGTPLAANAIMVVGDGLTPDASADALAGMMEACAAEGVAFVGGHTVSGAETLLGLSVIGASRSRVLTKHGASAGDALLLSKPLGVGMALRAHRCGSLADADLEPVLASMERSNRAASHAALEDNVTAATDVTGFGLLGHLAEMLRGGELGATIALAKVPVFAACGSLSPTYSRSTGIDSIHAYVTRTMPLVTAASRIQLAPLLDPQTSGGLLVAAPPSAVPSLVAEGYVHIGTVTNTNTIEVAS